MFGRRPMASSTCAATSSGAPSRQSTPTATFSPRGAKLMHSAWSRTAIPSASSIPRTASETSSSSCPISRGPFSTTVTSAPKRR